MGLHGQIILSYKAFRENTVQRDIDIKMKWSECRVKVIINQINRCHFSEYLDQEDMSALVERTDKYLGYLYAFLWFSVVLFL